jgi:hypothetical protein
MVTVLEEEVATSEDDDEIGLCNFGNVQQPRPASSAAAQIENDEEDAAPEDASLDYESSLLRVTLPHHSPDAVQILLEYCYTNRVEQLGYEAFVQASKTKPQDRVQGPSPPFPGGHPHRWPNQGKPIVEFRTALAALTLAEDASMKRLSLMCEIAAAQLVNANNVVDALSICESQKLSTGNPLPVLRKAAMEVVLRSGPRGVFALTSFHRALQDRSASMIPTLLTGTAEAVETVEPKKKKRDWKTMVYDHFDDVDYKDVCNREQERHRRRVERMHHLSEEDAEKLYVRPKRKDAQRRSLKRMSHHLGARLGNRVVASLAARRSRRSSR